MKTFLPATLLALLLCSPHLRAQTVNDSVILAGHSGSVNRASFNADGTRLITAGADGTARIWSVPEGTELRRLTPGSGPVLFAFLSKDGKEAITFTATEAARWNAETGAPKGAAIRVDAVSAKRLYGSGAEGDAVFAVTRARLYHFPFFSASSSYREYDAPTGQPGHLYDVAVSGDMSVGIAAGLIYYPEPGFPPGAPPSYGIELAQFVPPLGEPFRRDTLPFRTDLYAINFRPGSSGELGIAYSGTMLVAGTVYLNDWNNVTPFSHPLVRSVAFSGNGDRVVTLGGGVARIWKSNTELLDSLIDGVTDVVFSPDNSRMAVCRSNGTVTVRGKADTTTSPHPLQISLGRIDFGAVAVGSGRDTVVPLLLRNTGGNASISVEVGVQGNKSFRIMYDTLPDFRFKLGRNEGITIGLRFNPLDSGLKEGELSVLSYLSGEELPRQKVSLTGSGVVRTYFANPADSAMRLAANELGTVYVRFAANDSIVATESWYRSGNGAIALWEGETGQERERWNERLIGLMPDGERLLTQVHTSGAPIRVRSLRSGEILTELQGGGSSAFGGALSPDGTYAVVGEDGDKGRVWNLESGTVSGLFDSRNKALYQARFSPDNARIVVGGYNGDMEIWNVAENTTLPLVAGDTLASRVGIFTPDGTRVVSGSVSHNLILFWDVETGAIVRRLAGHSGRALPVAFSPDGAQLLTISEDGTAKVWDAAGGTELFTLRSDGSPMQRAAYSPDGYRIVTQGGTEGEFHIWIALTGELLKSVPHTPPQKKNATILEYRSSTVGFSSDDARLGIASANGDAVIYGPSVAMPYIVPDVDAVDLSGTAVGSDAVAEIALWNRGPVPLTLAPRFLPAADAFSLPDGADVFTIQPDERRTISVRYAPNRTERKDEGSSVLSVSDAVYLTFQYGDAGSIAHVRVQGNGSGTVSVGDEDLHVAGVAAVRIHPNPAGENTRITFETARPGVCGITLVNTAGKIVGTLLEDRQLSAGSHSVEVRIGDIPSGEYFVVLKTPDGQDVRTLRVLR